jgi:hypothetical protein
MSLRQFFTTQLVATCALCLSQRAHGNTTPAKLEAALLADGWRQVELENAERVYGGIICDFCARLEDAGETIQITRETT